MGGNTPSPKIFLKSVDAKPVSSELCSAQDDEVGSSAVADSPLAALRGRKPGHKALSAVAMNFVPQAGQVHISRSANPASLASSFSGIPGSGFHGRLEPDELAKG